MSLLSAQFNRTWNLAGTWLLSARGETITVLVLLTTHAGLLAYSATRHSPTHLEPAFLAAGISHWQFGRFELYRVNPPLVRMVAALPVLAVGCETDWSQFYDGPGSRAEFSAGVAWIKANGTQSIPLFFYARWACIPFSLIGGYFAYRWANELYGNGAGVVTLFIWTFEPNMLAHAEFITPDCACWAFGVLAGYTFWRWLKMPTWTRAGLAGLSLGLAELSKLSWLILFGLWPVLWLTWRWLEIKKGENPESRVAIRAASAPRLFANTQSLTSNASTSNPRPTAIDPRPRLRQLIAILLLAVYLLNLGYAFDGFGTRLKDFQFVSTTLTGLDESGQPGNRFRDTWLGQLPLPVPKQYVLGFDSQKKDFEEFHHSSYLRGEWKQGGWWYYYLYGLWVKVPCGLWLLFSAILVSRICRATRPVLWRDELVLLVPAVVLLVVVSAQTEFNIHLRYVYPTLALTTIFLGQSVGWSINQGTVATLFRTGMLGYFALSSLLVYPHHLAYFNEFVSGPKNECRHLLGNSLEWGQDLLLVGDAMQPANVRQQKYVLRQPNERTYLPEPLEMAVTPNRRTCPKHILNPSCFRWLFRSDITTYLSGCGSHRDGVPANNPTIQSDSRSVICSEAPSDFGIVDPSNSPQLHHAFRLDNVSQEHIRIQVQMGWACMLSDSPPDSLHHRGQSAHLDGTRVLCGHEEVETRKTRLTCNLSESVRRHAAALSIQFESVLADVPRQNEL